MRLNVSFVASIVRHVKIVVQYSPKISVDVFYSFKLRNVEDQQKKIRELLQSLIFFKSFFKVFCMFETIRSVEINYDITTIN